MKRLGLGFRVSLVLWISNIHASFSRAISCCIFTSSLSSQMPTCHQTWRGHSCCQAMACTAWWQKKRLHEPLNTAHCLVVMSYPNAGLQLLPTLCGFYSTTPGVGLRLLPNKTGCALSADSRSPIQYSSHLVLRYLQHHSSTTAAPQHTVRTCPLVSKAVASMP